MDSPDKAFKELAKKYREIEDIKSKIEVLSADLRIKEAHALGMEEVLKHFKKPTPAKVATLRPGTDVEKARAILQESATSLHVDDILKILGREVTKESRVSLAGSLTRYANDKRVFFKTGPNTFTLISRMTGDEDDRPLA